MTDEKQEYDLILLDGIKSKSKTAFKLLMQRYENDIFTSAFMMVKNKMDAEDLTMEIFEKVFVSINKYKPVYSFRTWLSVIARNHILDFIKTRKSGFVDIEVITYKISDDNNCEEEFIKYEEIQFLNRMMNKLTSQYQEVLRLRYYEDMSYIDMCSELGLPMNAVKVHLYRAKSNLHKLLTQNYLQ